MTAVSQAALVAATKGVGLLNIAHHTDDLGLIPPRMVDLSRDEHIVLWLDSFGSARWVDSIEVDADGVTPSENPSYLHRVVEGRTPELGFRVQLRFLQPVASYERGVA